MEIRFQRLDKSSFNERSLDGFERRQTVRACWRRQNGAWTLARLAYEEGWNLPERRAIAADIARRMAAELSAFGAFHGDQLIGFITVSHALFGRSVRYAQLACFQVSAPFRRQGVGRQLFALAAQEARSLGADKLYISACSAVETLSAYRALGCTAASEINARLAAEEPYDVPLEYSL